MCGIAGTTARQGERVSPETLEAMALAIRHRGPDDQGVWCSNDGRVGFGHRRLSIIDLSPAGHQPMHDGSGTLTIAFTAAMASWRVYSGSTASTSGCCCAMRATVRASAS